LTRIPWFFVIACILLPLLTSSHCFHQVHKNVLLSFERGSKTEAACLVCRNKDILRSSDSLVGARTSRAAVKQFGMGTGYGLDDRRVGVRVPVGSRIATSLYRPDGLWGPSSLISNAFKGLFPGDKTSGTRT
jgi:hypothetical protein